MANPIRSQSRVDKRPPAGANPQLPIWAKGDYVLERWVKEERQRRRNWLADQELHPSEPRPEWRPVNQITESLKAPFRKLIRPVDALTGNRLMPVLWKTGTLIKWFIAPMWVAHYVFKYHIVAKPGYFIAENRAVFPDNPLHKEDGDHH